MQGQVAVKQAVVHEVALYRVALVTGSDDEVVETLAGVELHDVPEHRPATDFDHGLGTQPGLFHEPRTQTAGQDDDFHQAPVRFGSVLGLVSASALPPWASL